MAHPHLMCLRHCLLTPTHLALVMEPVVDSLYFHAVYALLAGLLSSALQHSPTATWTCPA